MISDSGSNSQLQLTNKDENKYGGMIKRSFIKVIRDNLFSLFSYLDSVVPNFYQMHEFISIWRIIQFIGPCFCAANGSLWKYDSTERKAISIISIFYHLIPVEYRVDASIPFEFIYCGINIIFFLSILLSAKHYKKTAKLPNYLPSILSVYIHTFGYLIHPIALNLIGEDIGRLIDGYSSNNNTLNIVSIVLSIFCFLIWFVFFDQISVGSFLFRPNSLLSVLSTPQIILFSTTCIVTLLIAIASQLSKYPSVILTMLCAICYLGGILSVYTTGTYISPKHQRLLFSATIISSIVTLIMSIYIFIGKTVSFVEILIFIVAFVAIYIISIYILKLRLRNQMRMLDDYQNKLITIDDIKTPDQVVTLGIVGMQNAHPSCLNWTIFREGSIRWPLSVKIWITFGKFVAIYPSESALLSQIIYRMEENKLRGSLAKQAITQAKTIYTQRESSLTTYLKLKLSRGSKNVQITKRKFRHVWDLAIQGAIAEMESSIRSAYQSASKSSSYFNFLLSQYPNSKYVARNYLRFIKEIECDPKKTAEWIEKVSLLQRGIPISPDHANLLGLHAFPNLPDTISDSYAQTNLAESESFISETDNATEESSANQNEMNDQISIIRDHIDSLRIPSTFCIKTWNIFFYVVLLVLPSVIMMALLPKYSNSLSQSLHYMYHLSYLRSLAVQTPIFANRFLNEEIGFYPPPLMNMKPEAYGFQNRTDLMLRFLLKEMSEQVEKVSQYRSYQSNNKYVKLAHEIVFSGIIPYRFYANQKYSTNAASTLQGALTDVAMSSSKLLDIVHSLNCANDPDECWDLHNQTAYLNPYMNYGLISDNISQALNHMRNYLQENVDEISNLSMFIGLFICIVYALIIIGILVYQLMLLQKSKKSIYECLISLPKNVVSSVSESLRVLSKNDNTDTEKHEENDSEMNKQDENIMKIFSTSSDASSMKSLDKTVLIAASIFLFICAIVNTFTLSLTFPEIAEKLNNNAPHLDYILGSSGFGFSVIGAVDNLLLTSNCHGLTGSLPYNCEDQNSDVITRYLRSYFVNYTREKLSNFINYYSAARYGGEDNKVPPYPLFERAMEEADSITEGCEDYNISHGPPKYFSCYKSDIQLNLFKPLVTLIITPIGDGIVNRYDTNSEELSQLWNLITMGLCSKVLFPMFAKIVPQMEESLNKIIPPIQAVVVIVLILAFIDVLIIVIQIYSSEKKLKFALSFLTQCPPSAVLQSQKIMDILRGYFSNKSRDVSAHNSVFFDDIVQSIPDSVIVCKSNFIVLNINKSTERIYGVTKEDLVDKNAQDFFNNSEIFKSNMSELFEKANSNIRIEYKKKNEDNKYFLDIQLNQIGENYVILTRDVTQTVLYNTLIAEERVVSDRLLSSILPPNLVKRVQDGEKNISFGVQSATILFLDIVSFTPWCASCTAAMVMKTLNALFRKFDACLATHGTMTKIKCIGDCYMCAGGIFSEINQSAVHAKETVEFGLEAISSVEENNKEMNLSLNIRVGVNTGGPIVAGVLGTEKPTFEILGSAINMAQQMEQHGVPMKVHISRPTYELIYGGNFVIKERGQIEIKRGTVLTYLVESKK